MKVLVLHSQRRASGHKPPDAYAQTFGSSYAEKVLRNLKGESGSCTSCGPQCNACRAPYGRRFAGAIAGAIAFPAVLPYLLEKPEGYVPRDLPSHDVLLAINIHEQILIEIISRCAERGTRGVVVPLEAPDWVSGSARAEARALCRRLGMEIAFPKPFCSFAPPAESVLAAFRARFHIGKPEVRLRVEDGRIAEAHVEVSAPCGATYYVARWLTGERLDEDLKYRVVSKRLHSYPCTASMKWDPELGDSALHLAGQAHYEILAPFEDAVRQSPQMVMSPVGRMVLKPVPVRDNVANIQQARAAVLKELEDSDTVSLKRLRRKQTIIPAALDSALLILKREGKVRVERDRIRRT